MQSMAQQDEGLSDENVHVKELKRVSFFHIPIYAYFFKLFKKAADENTTFAKRCNFQCFSYSTHVILIEMDYWIKTDC